MDNPAAGVATGAPLPHNRRPRVREVSSRFMSPLVSSSSFSSSSSGDLHPLSVRSPLEKQTTASQHHNRSRSLEQLVCCADDNIVRSWDSPLASHNKADVVINNMPVYRKHRAVVKLFKENGEPHHHHQELSDVTLSKSLVVTSGATANSGKRCQGRSSSSRPDTPIINVAGVDRVIPSRFRTPSTQRHANIVYGAAPTAATKLLQSSGLSSPAQPSYPASREPSSQGEISIPLNPCSSLPDNAKTDAQNGAALHDMRSSLPASNQNSSRTQTLADMRSSMPEGDTRLLPDTSCSSSSSSSSSNSISKATDCHSSRFPASPCSRSLNLPLSSCDPSSLKIGERLASALSKPSANFGKMASLCPPLHPNCIKLATDPRKGKKAFTHQEDVHSLKLLHNHYLQWRYANAKAEASMHAQTKETERKLYAFGAKISDLREAVEKECIELGLLQRRKTLSTILEAHIPYLDEWSAFEEEYSVSLSGTSHALFNSLLQLPISGNVQADNKEVGEALNSAIKVMEMIGDRVQSFMPKFDGVLKAASKVQAREMNNLLSELARVVGGERALIDECGDLLFKTHASQVCLNIVLIVSTIKISG
ncbi:hypothetical protein RJ639_014917 [Escallonia herrerae]|uniref:Protein ENDOSPERM DEFECTIVE 1 n=1 Tax=Escallonia herrerae TaxID=1293975 RepID=A0AA89AQW7_9ASTE|nr:hypothetical protein RJ639_014917 [Escallonia herrerae]